MVWILFELWLKMIFWGFFIKLVVVVVLEMEKGVAAIWLGCYKLEGESVKMSGFKNEVEKKKTERRLKFEKQIRLIGFEKMKFDDVWMMINKPRKYHTSSFFRFFKFLIFFLLIFLIFLIYKWLCGIFNFFNLIITHVSCHIGVDRVKIDLNDYYRKGANSWGSKL